MIQTFYVPELIYPEEYTDLEYRDLVINGLRKKFTGGEATTFLDRLDDDTTFFMGYMDGKMLVVLRNAVTGEIVAHVLLMIIFKDERSHFIRYIPDQGFAVILQAQVSESKLEDITPEEAILRLIDTAEHHLKILSDKSVEEGHGRIDSIIIETSPVDWLINLMVPGQFLSYQVKFLLPYIQQHDRYDEEQHPVSVEKITEQHLQLMYPNMDEDVLNQIECSGELCATKFYQFEADEYDAIIDSSDEYAWVYIPQCNMEVPTIEIKRMKLHNYSPSQDEVINDEDVPRTIAAIEQIGEYACHRYSWQQLAIAYNGSDSDIDLIGAEYISSILFIRTLDHTKC